MFMKRVKSDPSSEYGSLDELYTISDCQVRRNRVGCEVNNLALNYRSFEINSRRDGSRRLSEKLEHNDDDHDDDDVIVVGDGPTDAVVRCVEIFVNNNVQ